MADEIIKEEKETEENKKANTAPTGRERFKELAARINQADKEALARRSERERLLKEGEAAREKSLDDTMSRMAENTELAKKAASERIARLEYRQSIMERTRRKRRTEAPISAAAEFAKPEEQLEIQSEASELSLEKADAEEYNEPKAVCTEALCAEESCAKSEAEATEKAEAEPFEEACEPPEATLGAEPEISGEAENTGETDALSVPEAETDAASVPDENDADIYSEKIILNINPEKKLDVEEDGDNVIRIGARQIFGVGAAAAVAHRVHIPRVGVSDPSAARAQILEAQRRHVALRNAAISNAAGAYEEEVRLLEEEEARYHAEIEQLRAKRLDLYERRDAFAPTAFAEEAREADLFDSFDEGSLYDRRIDEDAAIKEYEKTRRAELEFLRAAEEYELGESLTPIPTLTERSIKRRFSTTKGFLKKRKFTMTVRKTTSP